MANVVLFTKCMNKITVESGEPSTYTENEMEGTCMGITWEVRTAQELKILVHHFTLQSSMHPPNPVYEAEPTKCVKTISDHIS